MNIKNFILIGAAGYIAPRHYKAIRDTGNQLLAIYDPSDNVGVIDQYFPKAVYFNNIDQLNAYVNEVKNEGRKIDYVTICSPNYLHLEHIVWGYNIGADVICEKPISLLPSDIDALIQKEIESDQKVHSILQLRYHPALIDLKQKIDSENRTDYKITLDYITPRGPWYQSSWKGDIAKSGGIAMNIGVHFFDLLAWIFGDMKSIDKVSQDSQNSIGSLYLANAHVYWNLSIDVNKSPEKSEKPFRRLTIDGVEIDFSEGFDSLHTICYEKILAGNGYGLSDVKEGIRIASKIK